MDIVEEIVRTTKHLCETDSKKLKEKLSEELYNIYRPTDKIRIIESLLSITKEGSIKHSKVCQDPKNCNKSKNLALSEFYLIQELEILGVNTGSEIFSYDEQNEINDKLNKVLNEIEILKLGQEIIYDDLKAELDEMKTMYFLSKKTWNQLLVGKVFDMTLAGIISESVSKKIFSIIKDEVIKYIQN